MASHSGKVLGTNTPRSGAARRSVAADKEEAVPQWSAQEVCDQELPFLQARRQAVFPAAHPEASEEAIRSTLFGICLSGGGIRSATFNLGVLQGLASLKMLHFADYLSTVSGGGYIGAWLHGVIRQQGETYQDFLAQEDSLPTAAPQDPITFLRKYSNYLAPRLGFLSPDSWVIAAIWFRNTLLNQLVLFLWLAGALLIPQALVNCISHGVRRLAVDGAVKWPYVSLAFAGLAIAVLMMSINLRRLIQHEFSNRAGNAAHRTDDAPDNGFSVWLRVVLPLWISATVLSILATARLLSLTDLPTLIFSAVAVVALYCILLSVGGFWNCFTARHREHKIVGAALYVCIVLVSSSATLGLLASAWWLLEHGEGQTVLVCMTFGPILILFALVLGVILCVGLMGMDFPDSAREWTSAISARNLIMTVCWAAIFLISAFAPPLIAAWFRSSWHTAYAALLTWLASTAIGVLSGKSALTTGQHSSNEARKSKSLWLEAAAVIMPPIAVLGLLLATSTALYFAVPQVLAALPMSANQDVAAHQQSTYLWLLALAPLGVAALLSTRFNINEFSMSHFYKNRLVRCYLGASSGANRRSNRVTGFDPKDDFRLTDLLPGANYKGPFAILNCAVNLNHGKELAWQERKASSFIFTPKACGFTPADKTLKSYVATASFTDKNGPRLGTAVATSGAAVNPNWGYHTNPATAFLLTIFNVRLGLWVGNTLNKKTCRRPGPRVAIGSLLSELLGWTDIESKFVNLSDGGHFENLGLYELLRRKCRLIIVGDGEQDAAYIFESLGGAIRKARIDFGYVVSISPRRILLKDGSSEAHCAMGRVDYGNSEVGTILYLKSSLTGDEPYDITQYRKQHGDFPHQSTANQFFTESQFESYRQLGKHIVAKVFAGADTPADYSALKTIFKDLEETWTCTPIAVPGVFSRHAEAYSSLLRELASDPDLRFLDPEIIESPFQAPEPTPVQTEKGHLFCLRCLQLMESVYFDLGLEDDDQWNHRGNAGWKTVFTKWKSGTHVDMVWRGNQGMFSHSFRMFYPRISDTNGARARVVGA